MAAIPFLDLAAMHEEVRAELDAAWRIVTTQGSFVSGEHVERFEAEWAAYCGVEHCVSVGNGTDALTLALRALGIGPGDEVVLPANTFIATAEAITAVGAIPVFVDVDPRTLLVTAEHISAALGPRTAAVVVVHLYGQPVDLEAVEAVTRRAGVALVEDAAQAHGAAWRGRRPGWFGHAAAYSFYPGKNLGAFGDGGAVVTRDAGLADRVRLLSTHGRSPADRFTHVVDGCNSRLDGLQAAILSVKLARLDEWNTARRRVAATYTRLLDGIADLGVRLVPVADGVEAVHHVFPVLVPDRDEVRRALEAKGVATNLHYPIACHEQEPFAAFATMPLPVVEEAARTELSLPMFPHLADSDVGYVCRALRAALEDQRDRHG